MLIFTIIPHGTLKLEGLHLSSVFNSVLFFISCGFPTPPNYNPADHFVRILAIEPGKEAESQIRIEVVYCQGFGVHPDHSSSLIMLDIFINLLYQFIVSL